MRPPSKDSESGCCASERSVELECCVFESLACESEHGKSKLCVASRCQVRIVQKFPGFAFSICSQPRARSRAGMVAQHISAIVVMNFIVIGLMCMDSIHPTFLRVRQMTITANHLVNINTIN